MDKKTRTAYSDTEERIFKAAITVFGEQGRKGARMQEIADLAGTNKALVYYYFRSKDRLYSEVFRYMLNTDFRHLGEAIQDADDFPALLRSFIDNYMDALLHNPVLIRFMVNEISAGAPVLSPMLREMIGSGLLFPPTVFLDAFEQGKGRGEIRDTGAVHTMITLIGACVYSFIATPIFSVLQPGVFSDTARFLEERKAHLSDILLHGLLPREESNR